MQLTLSFLAFGLSASAALVPRLPAGCCFHLNAAGGVSGGLGQLSDGQNRVGPSVQPGTTYCINQGGITDASGRGCILTPPTTQFQCDVGATPTLGFAIGSMGQVTYNGSGTFYACPVDNSGNYNIYSRPVSGMAKCVQVTLTSDNQQCFAKASSMKPSSTSTAKPSTYKPITSVKLSTAPTSKMTSTTVSTKPTTTVTSTKPATTSVSTKPTTTSVSTKPASTAVSTKAASTVISVQPAPVPMTMTQTVTVSGPSVTKTVTVQASCPAPQTVTKTVGGVAPVPVQTSAVPTVKTSAVSSVKPSTMVSSVAKISSQARASVVAPSVATSMISSKASNIAVSTKASTMAPMSTGAPYKNTTSAVCPQNLNGNYLRPNLIVPVDSSKPNTAFGTMYNGTVSSTVSSIFNFDIPTSYAGKTCSAIFFFPQKSQLQTSSFTEAGTGGIDFKLLKSPATSKTSFSNVPATSVDLGTIAVHPGNSYTIISRPCPAGQSVTYELSSTGGYSLNFFEDYNPSPIGLFIRQC